MVLTLVFAAVAFTLAVIGVYGVLTWAVTQRFGEIGVRVALGAQARDIVRMVLAQGGKLVAIGSALGVVGAVALGRVLASQIRNGQRVRSRGARRRGARARGGRADRELAAGAPGRNTDPLIALRAE